jgi:predicted aspartyl protease
MTARVRSISPLLRMFPYLVIVFFMLGGCGSTSSQPDLAENTLPITTLGTHVAVEAEVNGKPVTLLLDTGADQNVLTAAAATRLGLPLSTGTVPGQGAGGEFGPVSWVHIQHFALGEARLRDQLAFVVPLPREFTADGVLGTPFFNAFIVTIDYQRKNLTLRSKRHFVPPAGAVSIPVTLDRGKLVVTATAAGMTGDYVIDTGAANALTIFTPAVARAGLRDTLRPAIRTVTGISAGGRTLGDLVRVPEIVIGPYRFTHVVSELSLAQAGNFASARYIGNLGGELWRRFTVTLDYAAGDMYLEPNDSFVQPFVPPRSGVVALFAGDELRVADVMPNSPGADAGIAVGDAVVTVDGVAALQLSPYTLREIFHQTPGSRVRLRLRDSLQNERDATLVLRDLL